MGIGINSLENPDAGTHFTSTGWGLLLMIAREFAWKPRGTVDPGLVNELDAREWQGSYFSNDLQIVTAEDAAELGAALHRALLCRDGFVDAWENEARAHDDRWRRWSTAWKATSRSDDSTAVDFSLLERAEGEPDAYEPLTPEQRDQVFLVWGTNAKEIIAVCNGGAFDIS